MSVTKIKNNVIALTTDPDQLTKLRNKLAEYAERYGFQAPEADPHETYKFQLLGALLDEGIIDVDEKEAAFSKNDWHQPAAFRDAVAIITAYNTDELVLVRGGTGLK